MIKSVLEQIQTGNDYCKNCGCPLDICCGKNKVSFEEHQKFLDASKGLKLRVIELELEIKKSVSLEWLEDEFDKYDGISINNFKRRIMKAAKKQASEEK